MKYISLFYVTSIAVTDSNIEGQTTQANIVPSISTDVHFLLFAFFFRQWKIAAVTLLARVVSPSSNTLFIYDSSNICIILLYTDHCFAYFVN